MPIYTYECQSCGSSLDRRQSFSDEPLKTHDDCGGNLRRVIYPAGIVFKGSGFYNTDYKNGTSAKKESESTDSKTDATKSDASKSDSSAGSVRLVRRVEEQRRLRAGQERIEVRIQERIAGRHDAVAASASRASLDSATPPRYREGRRAAECSGARCRDPSTPSGVVA